MKHYDSNGSRIYGNRPIYYQGAWENVPENFTEYSKCDNCYCEVPTETLVTDPVYSSMKICKECEKAIKEETTI